jgi:hypothetical protein
VNLSVISTYRLYHHPHFPRLAVKRNSHHDELCSWQVEQEYPSFSGGPLAGTYRISRQYISLVHELVTKKQRSHLEVMQHVAIIPTTHDAWWQPVAPLMHAGPAHAW